MEYIESSPLPKGSNPAKEACMANETARIVRFHSVGGPEVLKIQEESIQEPGKGEVRLRVKAIGLNRAEVMFRQGQYLEAPVLPSKLGYEAAGVVEAVGPDVDKSWLGKKASTVPAFLMTEYGVYGEVAIVPASALAIYPEKLTPEEGTSIWMQYLTAYGALIAHAQITKGDFVIITAASSSVGIAAIEMAKAEGAISIATTRTSKKKATLVEVGATHVIATEEEDFIKRVNEITGGKGARVIFDPIAGKGIELLAQAAALGGTIFEYGALASGSTPFPLFTALGKGLSVRGYTLREVLSVPKLRAKAEQYVFDQVKAGDFKPRIDRVFPFAEIVEAHRYMESNEQIGKIVVAV
jgi:NADPH:quinone reductase-like Zn-dependent oxidoreductase